MEFANDQATPDDWFKGFPSLKQLAVICIATEIAGVLLRAVLGWVWSTTIMAVAPIAFFAIAVHSTAGVGANGSKLTKQRMGTA